MDYTVGFPLIGLSAIVSSTVLRSSDGDLSRTMSLAAGIIAVAPDPHRGPDHRQARGAG
jgi:hypothetical protein